MAWETSSRLRLCLELYQLVLKFPNVDQNSPQKLKYGVYPEQLSGSAFTVKRAHNQKTWLYKMRPSAIEGQYSKSKINSKIIASYIKDDNLEVTPNQLRWRPIPDVKNGESKDFV